MVDWEGIEVIDADGHVIEPAAVWREYSDPAFRARLDRPGGGVQALGMSRSYPDSTTGLEAAASEEGDGEGAGWRSSTMATDTWKEGVRKHLELPGGYDPRARLADMDEEGIDVAVLYPTSMLTWVEEVRPVRRRMSGLQQLAARLLRRGTNPPVPGRVGSGSGPGRGQEGAAALRRPVRRQGGDGASGALPGHQAAPPPRLRPVLGCRRRGGRAGRCASLAPRRHAELLPVARARRLV